VSAPPPELHVSDDPAGAVARLLADQAARGGSIVLTGGGALIKNLVINPPDTDAFIVALQARIAAA